MDTPAPVPRTRSRTARRTTHAGAAARCAGTLSIAALSLGLAACGDYAPGADADPPPAREERERPGRETPADGDRPDPEGGSGGGGIPDTYAWGLPPSDVSLTGNDGPAYQALRSGCSEAEQYLAAVSVERPFTSNPYGFLNARYTEFYAAGLALCRGDVGAARIYRDHALARWTTAGIDRPGDPKNPDGTDYVGPPRPPGYGEPECDLYRTLASVLDQVAPDSIVCPGGDRPGHVFVDYIVDDGQGPYTTSIYDDPMTLDVDESLIVPANAVDPSPPGSEVTPDAPSPEPSDPTTDAPPPAPGEVAR
ncbi:hypothetical protein [Microbacterium cremeum]|uniref:hypothetical protein n=1 Tax=Microbacterium cremeum TaxID=2782169 RepID=UPI001889C21E|nr:hypothetical protein [Microbacterium cremeum]